AGRCSSRELDTEFIHVFIHRHPVRIGITRWVNLTGDLKDPKDRRHLNGPAVVAQCPYILHLEFNAVRRELSIPELDGLCAPGPTEEDKRIEEDEESEHEHNDHDQEREVSEQHGSHALATL